MCALPRFGPNALANNIIAKRRVPRLLLPHAAGGKAVDVVPVSQPFATTRWAVDRFPIRTVPPSRPAGCQVSANYADAVAKSTPRQVSLGCS